MRPATLAQMAERIASGEATEVALSEFLDAFYLAGSREQQLAMLVGEPKLNSDVRINALLGAVAEYLAHHHELTATPTWAFGAPRYHDRAWHTSPFADDAFREYLAFASPAEFSSRNIFTEEAPLRRARLASAGMQRPTGS
jgi:hypothetical protein